MPAILAQAHGRGRPGRGGVRGVPFSLPELVFQNVRKGSFEYVPL